MKLADIPYSQLVARAKTSGIRYRTGPFTVCLKTHLPDLVALLHRMYGATPVVPDDGVCHFHVTMDRPGGLRRWLKPQVVFTIDGFQPFDPFPVDHAFPLLEWGLNWCIGSAANGFLILHSAVVEKNGKAIIFPALPGSGKSTLCSGLINRGWRLLSDEFGIIDQQTGEIIPIPRAIPLKNYSIGVIKAFAPDTHIGPTFPKTRKGDVAHLAPPVASLEQQFTRAKAAFVVFPKFQCDAELSLIEQKQSVAFTRLSNNSFNYQLTMEEGFHSLVRLVRQSQCYGLGYGNLNEAIAALDKLVEAED